MEPLKIIIVDDNLKFRQGLRFYIENILNYSVINEAENGMDFMELPNRNLADIILMDISMPEMDGILTSKNLLSERKTRIIAITSYEEQTYLNELIEVGIKGCVFKKDIYEHLNLAIKKVMNHDYYFPKEINLKKL